MKRARGPHVALTTHLIGRRETDQSLELLGVEDGHVFASLRQHHRACAQSNRCHVSEHVVSTYSFCDARRIQCAVYWSRSGQNTRKQILFFSSSLILTGGVLPLRITGRDDFLGFSVLQTRTKIETRSTLLTLCVCVCMCVCVCVCLRVSVCVCTCDTTRPSKQHRQRMQSCKVTCLRMRRVHELVHDVGVAVMPRRGVARRPEVVVVETHIRRCVHHLWVVMETRRVTCQQPTQEEISIARA